MDIKPQDWFNTRYISYIPDHFVSVKITSKESLNKVLFFIEENTSGRYSIANAEMTDNDNTISIVTDYLIVGFELESDATVFGLFYKY